MLEGAGSTEVHKSAEFAAIVAHSVGSHSDKQPVREVLGEVEVHPERTGQAGCTRQYYNSTTLH